MGRRQGCSKKSQENYESSHFEIGMDFSCNTLKQKWGALMYFHWGLYTPPWYVFYITVLYYINGYNGKIHTYNSIESLYPSKDSFQSNKNIKVTKQQLSFLISI